MQVNLTRPELVRFIHEQVAAGSFASSSAAIEAAVEQMMLACQEATLTEEDVETIKQSEAEFDDGEFVDFEVFAERMRQKHCGH
jgi:Arc/MetJ-type ribon-helix-helix transcriptional regulator